MSSLQPPEQHFKCKPLISTHTNFFKVRQIVRGEVVGALRDSSPRQHSTPKPDFKMATMRQNIQVPKYDDLANIVSCVDILLAQAHIQAGRIEAAFQAALSASDLQMVTSYFHIYNPEAASLLVQPISSVISDVKVTKAILTCHSPQGGLHL